MQSEQKIAPKSTVMRWIGIVIGALPVIMLLFSAAMKFVKPSGFAEGLEHLGWIEGQMFGLGILEIACTVVYLVPRTAILGAILITGYLGGAVATHVRVGDPFWIPVLLGVLVWLGLYLRDDRIRALVPLRR